MKKLLYFVLIAVAISTVMETSESEEVLKAADWAAEWNKVKGAINSGVNWLKEKGLYYPIVNAITSQGQKQAETVCRNYGLPGALCSNIVSWILRNVLGQ